MFALNEVFTRSPHLHDTIGLTSMQYRYLQAVTSLPMGARFCTKIIVRRLRAMLVLGQFRIRQRI